MLLYLYQPSISMGRVALNKPYQVVWKLTHMHNALVTCISYYYTAPCLPSPCINDGTCVIMNVTDQQCICVHLFSGQFCEVKVSEETLH